MTALHGFFGFPSDWDGILPPSAVLPAWIPLLAALPGGAKFALGELAEQLNAQATAEPDVLIGYSMGGRVALHMLLQDKAPRRWSKAVIVSASPGLASAEDRKRRLEHDRKWAERFRTESVDTLKRDWNMQAVLAGEQEPERNGVAFDTSALAEVLVRGSVGAQDDLRARLATLEIPVLWIAGAYDAKYSALAEECAGLNPRFQVKIVPSAGHRVPWSATVEFQRLLSTFLE